MDGGPPTALGQTRRRVCPHAHSPYCYFASLFGLGLEEPIVETQAGLLRRMAGLSWPRLAPRLDSSGCAGARARGGRRSVRPRLGAEARAGVTALGLTLPLALLLAPQMGVSAIWLAISSIVASAVVALFGGTPFMLSGAGVATAGAGASLAAHHGQGRAGAGVRGLRAAAARGRSVRAGAFRAARALAGGGRLRDRAGRLGAVAGGAARAGSVRAGRRRSGALSVIDQLLAGRGMASLPALAIAALSCAATFAGRRLLPRAPVGLVVVALAAVAVAAGGLAVPRLPDLPLALPAAARRWRCLPRSQYSSRPRCCCFGCSASAETLLSSVAEREPAPPPDVARPDPDQDLIGHGLANVAIAFLGGVPATGAMIRGEAVRRAGGRGPAAALVHALLSVPALVLLLAVDRFVPLAALAGVAAAHALPLLSPAPWRAILVASRGQAAILAVTCAVMVAKGLLAGIETGLALSLLAVLSRVGRTRVTVHHGAAGAPHQITFSGPVTFLSSSRLAHLDRELSSLDPSAGGYLRPARRPHHGLHRGPTAGDDCGRRRRSPRPPGAAGRRARLPRLLLAADRRNLVGMRLAVTEVEVDGSSSGRSRSSCARTWWPASTASARRRASATSRCSRSSPTTSARTRCSSDAWTAGSPRRC